MEWISVYWTDTCMCHWLFCELQTCFIELLYFIFIFKTSFQILFEYVTQTYAAYLSGEDSYDAFDEELSKLLGISSFFCFVLFF